MGNCNSFAILLWEHNFHNTYQVFFTHREEVQETVCTLTMSYFQAIEVCLVAVEAVEVEAVETHPHGAVSGEII
jgi:hypothetical protein